MVGWHLAAWCRVLQDVRKATFGENAIFGIVLVQKPVAGWKLSAQKNRENQAVEHVLFRHALNMFLHIWNVLAKNNVYI